MRTTLNIDDEIYDIIKELAFQNNQSIGDTVSKLIKQNIEINNHHINKDEDFPTLPKSANKTEMITIERINKIREELGE